MNRWLSLLRIVPGVVEAIIGSEVEGGTFAEKENRVRDLVNARASGRCDPDELVSLALDLIPEFVEILQENGVFEAARASEEARAEDPSDADS